jgi:hypothetical protein
MSGFLQNNHIQNNFSVLFIHINKAGLRASLLNSNDTQIKITVYCLELNKFFNKQW